MHAHETKQKAEKKLCSPKVFRIAQNYLKQKKKTSFAIILSPYLSYFIVRQIKNTEVVDFQMGNINNVGLPKNN